MGLPHNMGSSVAYPIDSLRSPTFTAKHGTAPSIMDYARFNHVAQPGDGVTNFYPMIGEYDVWSIIYGYKLVRGAKSPEEERMTLNSWIKERANDPVFRYGRQRGNTFDPTSQTEDLGEDAMRSGELGIANLKRIVPKLMQWTKEDGPAKDYRQLEEMYEAVYGQFGKYVRHVATNIGGVIERAKSTDQEGIIYKPVDKATQERALKWLDEQVLQTPDWLLDKSILQQIEPIGAAERMRRFQVGALARMFDKDRLRRLEEAEALYGSENVFTILSLFKGTKDAVFAELQTGASIDNFRMSLQRGFIDQMERLIKLEDTKYDQTSMKAMARGVLRDLQKELKAKAGDDLRGWHFMDLVDRIEGVFEDGE